MNPTAATCPRCLRNTATPFDAAGVCLRCAGLRALALDLDEDDVVVPAPPAGSPAPLPSDRAALPARIGPYEIIDELGRGGMARVFAARQPRLDRLVALKVLGTNPANEALEQRFLREIQTVARLRRPHIVAIHDSGRADGFIYFAMDYIEDGDLAHRLREHPFAPRAAAVLIQKVAAALAYAHGEGVLHRDLKPSNILLDGDEPHLADFGLAAQIEPGGDLTATSAVLGTPHYLAPEAVKGGSAAQTAQSDLYALGVVLYELLAGRTPFAGASAAELPALLQSAEPPPLRLLAPATPRDLETICFKCLERDPARRYATAAGLAEDLRRFLAGEPIVARPPGARERFGRFARRHRTALLATTATGVTLVAATVVSSVLAVRSARAERHASAETAAANAVVAFLKDDLLAKASPKGAPSPSVPLRTVLDLASGAVEKRFAQQPEVEAPIREALGVTYMALGDYPVARRHLARALLLTRQQAGADDLKTLHLEHEFTEVLIKLHELGPAEAGMRRVFERFRSQLGPDHASTLDAESDLAAVFNGQGKYAEAEKLFRDAVSREERVLGPDDPGTINGLNSLGAVLLSLGRFDEGKQVLQRGLERARRVLGPGDEVTIEFTIDLAGVHFNRGEFEQGIAVLQPAIADARRGIGPDHPATLAAMSSLAAAYLRLRRLPEAVDWLDQALAGKRRVLGPDHPSTLTSQNTLAGIYREQGRIKDAIALRQEVLEKRTRVLGPEHADTVKAMDYLGSDFAEQGDFPQAAALHARALALREKVLGPLHPDTLETMRNLGYDQLQMNHLAEAEPLLREALVRDERKPPGPWQTALVRCRLGAVLARAGRRSEARPLLETGYAELQRTEAQIPAISRRVVGEARGYVEALAAADAAAGDSLQRP